MLNKSLTILVLILSIVYIRVRSDNKASFFNEETRTIVVKDTTNNDIQTMKVEDYLVGVLAGEMPASFDEEALKAQAIASRTFAYYKIKTSGDDYDLTNDTSSQVHISDEQMHINWGNEYDKYLKKIKKAIKDTENIVITYNGDIIPAYYFSMSNGYTENVENVFSEQEEYLKSVSSLDDKKANNFEYKIMISRIDFCNKLDISCENIKIDNIERNSTNRVNKIKINDKEYKGVDIRKLLNLRSTDFVINIKDDNIEITTYGYGHGVGMSQYGANFMANKGHKYNEILAYYYQNTELQNINEI